MQKAVFAQLRVPCLEIKESSRPQDIRKLVRADKADLYVVDDSLHASAITNGVMQLGPVKEGDVLIVPATAFTGENVAQELQHLQRFFEELEAREASASVDPT
jgi:hypothetical protein